MNEPIISPWLFYWLDVIESFDKLNGIFALILLIGNSFLLFIYYILAVTDSNSYRHDKDREERKKVKLFLRKTLPLLIVTLIGVVFVPSKEAMYKMLVANYITQNNVNIAKQNMYDIVEHISNIVIKQINKEQKK